MLKSAVMLGTSFLICLLNEEEKLHTAAVGYFKFLLDSGLELLVRTIAVAEYCVRGKLEELPLANLRIVPFNLPHASCAGECARVAFEQRALVSERRIIPNDCKLFAQAHVEGVSYFLTSDARALNVYKVLQDELKHRYQFIDSSIPPNEAFGTLGL